MLSIQKGAISRMSLRIAASDISQGQSRCCVFKKVQYRPMPLHIAASAISQGQTGVLYSKRCNIVFCLCMSLLLLYHKDKTVLCIQNGTVSPLEFVHKVQMLKLRGLCTCMRVY